MADILSRAQMEQVIKDGGSVLLPGQPGQAGRIIRRLEDLPTDDQLAAQGLADPRAALAELQLQEAELARRKADLLGSLPTPAVEAVTTPPVVAVTTPEESRVEAVPPPEAAASSAEDPLDDPAEGQPAGRRRKGW